MRNNDYKIKVVRHAGFQFPALHLVWFLAIFLAGLNSFGQPAKRLQRMFDDAVKYHTQRNYDLAIENSLKILSKDSSFTDAHLLLSDIYHEQGNKASEIYHLEKASRLANIPLIQMRLGNAYFSSGGYEKALESYQAYITITTTGGGARNEVEQKIKSCRFALEALRNPVEFKPERLSGTVNSTADEYWPSLSIDQQQLVYTRLIKAPGTQPQEDFYMSEFVDGAWQVAQPVNEINTWENEGAQALSADGNILFFTACNRAGGFGSCDIYYSVRRDGRWSTPVNAGRSINSSYWEAQPSFSSDGRYLYFSSNRGGGKGKRDIWRIECLGFDNHNRLIWDKPVNLGDSINTPGNETSPFIHAGNKDFYFSSDYHTGMGGFDIFVSHLEHDSLFSRLRNLGYPINTFNNEQGLHIGADGLTAYFSSARDSTTGLDIYSFPVDQSIRPHPATYVKAFVADAETGKPVQAQIDLQNLEGDNDSARSEFTDGSGEILICLPSGNNYAFSVSKSGYLFYSSAFDLRDARQIYNPYELHILLEPVKQGAEMNLYNVYFETDSFRILPESEPELQKLVEFLSKNPGLSVEVQGHTDDTGSEDRNRDLSDQRARSVVNYLVEHGIIKDRLQWAGYGENRPVAENTSEEGRRQNRRTTIKILQTGK